MIIVKDELAGDFGRVIQQELIPDRRVRRGEHLARK
jgi:hypothetical protein